MRTPERSTLKAREAAAYLGVSYWLLLEMAKRGEVPHIRAGKLVLFQKEALDDWMRQQEQLSVREG